MKTLEKLKKEVFEKLSQHKKIEAFFKDSLEERMKIDDGWIENALIHNILEGIWQDHPLVEPIDLIYDGKENFEILRNKLTPKDDYDRKMHDVFAELKGYSRLKESGFEGIKALQEDSGRKKPEFSAQLNDQPYLFEVKNMRAPIEVCDLLLVKAKVRGLRFPEIYETLSISFKPSQNWLEVELNRSDSKTLKKEVKGWLEQTFTKIECAEAPASGRIEPFNLASQGLTIECNLKKGKNLGACCGLKRGVMVSDPDYKRGILLPFNKKVQTVTEHALEQLLEYDQDNVHKKYVLLNWQKSLKYESLVWDGFEEDVFAIVENIDLEFKSRHESLSVRLLNSDSLP